MLLTDNHWLVQTFILRVRRLERLPMLLGIIKLRFQVKEVIVRALYNNQLIEEGFLLVIRDSLQNKNTFFPIQNYLRFDQKPIQVKIDSSLYLACYSNPVTNEKIKNSHISFDDRKELFPVMILLPQQFSIFPDGTYTGVIETMKVRGDLFGLSAILPLEYGYLKPNENEFVHTPEMLIQQAIQDSIIKQLALFPQEKIYLHTDRTIYVPGEKIRFKAYVVDAASHQSTSHSRYVYVELITPSDSRVHRVMISPDDNGVFHGHLFLSELMTKGDYTLRAYTRHMENLGDDYFFKKKIRIEHLNKVAGVNPMFVQNDFDVSFFPEGGYLTEGVVSRVAFKALNPSGASEHVNGQIVDKEGNLIREVNTVFAGMGSFSFIPQDGEDYFLQCKNSAGLEKRFKLPEAKKTCSIKTSSLNKRHLIQLIKSPDLSEKPLYMLVQCKGEVLYFDWWNHRKEAVSLQNDQLPSGVIQVLLLDESMSPISERLIFNKNEDHVSTAFSSDKSSYQKREKVSSVIRVTDPDGNTFAGHLSVAVTDDKDMTIDTLQTITANLLLSSELRGHIESPGFYLQDDPLAVIALDHLMLTHGWRRYEITEAIKGHYTFPKINYESSKGISGAVKSLILRRPVINSEVTFLSNYGAFGQTMTDSAGLFRFEVHYPDSVQFFVQALTQKGKEGVELTLNQETFPKVKHAPFSLTEFHVGRDQENKQIDYSFDFLKKAEQRSKYDEDMKLVQLSEVTVSAKTIDKRNEVRRSNWATDGDHVIYREEIDKRNPQLVTHLLRTVSGVTIYSNGTISLRANWGLPLVLIDGIPEEWPDVMTTIYDSPLEKVDVLGVESIDIFKSGGKTAFFGPQGGNGVISITTRRGANSPVIPPPNYKTFAPLGYQKPTEFYAPQYGSPESKILNIPDYRTTIYWKPDIIVNVDGKASFDFYTSDFNTTYSVVIEGLTSSGKIIRQVEKIEMR